MTTRRKQRKIVAMGKPKPKYFVYGERLKRAREALGFEDAKDFADTLGMNHQTYRNYERGDREMKPHVLQLFAKHGMSLDYLIMGEGPVLKVRRIGKAS